MWFMGGGVCPARKPKPSSRVSSGLLTRYDLGSVAAFKTTMEKRRERQQLAHRVISRRCINSVLIGANAHIVIHAGALLFAQFVTISNSPTQTMRVRFARRGKGAGPDLSLISRTISEQNREAMIL